MLVLRSNSHDALGLALNYRNNYYKNVYNYLKSQLQSFGLEDKDEEMGSGNEAVEEPKQGVTKKIRKQKRANIELQKKHRRNANKAPVQMMGDFELA